jgi:3-oxoacyl-[acyl-carrier protein] reductase
MTVVALTPGTTSFSHDLRAALRDLGVDAALVQRRSDDRRELREAFAQVGAEAVVLVCGDESATVPGGLAETGPAEWDQRGERLLREALATLQAAHDHFAAAGRGRLVVVTSTAGISGAATIVPFVTAAEGVRAMAKSAARQWGAHGVTVNAVLVPLGVLDPDAAGVTPFLTPPALGATTPMRDVATAVRWFAGADGTGITGATVVADGGAVMVP